MLVRRRIWKDILLTLVLVCTGGAAVLPYKDATSRNLQVRFPANPRCCTSDMIMLPSKLSRDHFMNLSCISREVGLTCDDPTE